MYVAIDGAVFSDGDESTARGNIEDVLSDALERNLSGRTLGGGYGTEESYIDILLFDGDNSQRIVQESLKGLQLQDRSRIENFV